MKIKTLLVISIIVLCLYTNVIAVTAVSKELDDIMRANMPEMTEDFKMGVVGTREIAVPTNFGSPYKVYLVDLEKVKTGVDDFVANTIQEYLNDDYFWEYPLIDAAGKVVYTVDIEKVNGDWSLEGYPASLSGELAEFSANRDLINKRLSDKGIYDIKDIKHLETGLGVELIYVETEQGQYLIPLNSGTNDLGLEDKKIYLVKHVINRIKAELIRQNKATLNNTQRPRPAGSDGGTNQKTTETIYQPLALSVVFIVLSIFGLFLYQRHRVKR